MQGEMGRTVTGLRCLPDSMFAPDDFIAVTPALIRELAGDATAAMILIRIRWRQNVYGRVDDETGKVWWKASFATIAEDTGLSFDQVRRGVERLEKAGYVERLKQRRDGKFDQVVSYHVPKPDDLASTPHQTPDPMQEGTVASTPETVASTPNQTVASTPETVASTPSLIGKEDEEEELEEEERSHADAAIPLIPGAPPAPPDTKRRTAGKDYEGFDLWYALYPRKVGRGAAREAYGKVRGRGVVDQKTLTDAVTRFAEECRGRDKTFIPHPATWLNQERWADEPSPSRGRPVANGSDAHWAAGGSFFGEVVIDGGPRG